MIITVVELGYMVYNNFLLQAVSFPCKVNGLTPGQQIIWRWNLKRYMDPSTNPNHLEENEPTHNSLTLYFVSYFCLGVEDPKALVTKLKNTLKKRYFFHID